MKKRIDWIDIAKGFGMLVIVLGHVLRVGYLKQFTYAFSVPFYLIISGLTYKYQDSKEFIKKKFFKIMIPYYCFSIISILVYFVIGRYFQNLIHLNQDEIGFFNNVVSMLYGNSRYLNMEWNRPLWFLPTYFISINIVNILEKSIKNKRSILLLILLVLSYVVSLNSSYIYLPLQLETGLIFILYIEIGICLKNVLIKKDDINKNKYVLLSLIGILSGCILSYLNGSADLRIMTFGNSYFMYILVSLIFSISLNLLFIVLDNKLKLLSLVGRNSLSIMCMHKFPVMFFQIIIPITKNILLNNYESILMDVTSIAVSIMVIAMCLCVTYLLNMYFPYMYGTKTKFNIFKREKYE